MASSAPPAYPQRGQPATTPQQTLPTIPESHEEASPAEVPAHAQQPAGPCCAWPAAAAWTPGGQTWLAAAALAAAYCGEDVEEQKRRRQQDAVVEAAAAAGPPPRRRRVDSAQPSGPGTACGQEYCLAVPMPRAIPAALLSLEGSQAARMRQELHAAWAVVPYTPPGSRLLPGCGAAPHEPRSNGVASPSCATRWRLQDSDAEQVSRLCAARCPLPTP